MMWCAALNVLMKSGKWICHYLSEHPFKFKLLSRAMVTDSYVSRLVLPTYLLFPFLPFRAASRKTK
eukprot:scaffold2258_cov84-Skeletonema_dohrnii-CCMP3373.AAC.3